MADGAIDGPDNGGRYAAWGAAALALYDVVPERVDFLGHNSGIAYRVSAGTADHAFLLKIHHPRGTAPAVDPEHLEGVLVWLEDLSHMSVGFPLQRPVPDAEGRLLPFVHLPGLGPVACSLQTWVEGEASEGDLTEGQAAAIGTMAAALHTCATGWAPSRPVSGQVIDAEWFSARLAELNNLIEPDLVTAADRRVLESAGRIVGECLTETGRSSSVFGPIHGDLHQENIVFGSDGPRPIDFAFLRWAPYLWDLGVMAYHTMYLPAVVRRASIEAYLAFREIAESPELSLETFLVASAIDNLAFQVTIPEQRTSPGLRRNLRQLTHEYCRLLVAREPFVLT